MLTINPKTNSPPTIQVMGHQASSTGKFPLKLVPPKKAPHKSSKQIIFPTFLIFFEDLKGPFLGGQTHLGI